MKLQKSLLGMEYYIFFKATPQGLGFLETMGEAMLKLMSRDQALICSRHSNLEKSTPNIDYMMPMKDKVNLFISIY